MISLDQTPLAQAKAHILMDLNLGHMYLKKPEIYLRVFEPLRCERIEQDGILGDCFYLSHPEPEIIDDRLQAMIALGLAKVYDGAFSVEIEARDE